MYLAFTTFVNDSNKNLLIKIEQASGLKVFRKQRPYKQREHAVLGQTVKPQEQRVLLLC